MSENGKTTKEVAKLGPKEKEALKLYNEYVEKAALDPKKNFSSVPIEMRLSLMQTTKDVFVKTRKIGGTMIPYVQKSYVEKALNFISDFNWGFSITDKKFEEISFKKPKVEWQNRKKVFIKDDKGNQIFDEALKYNCYVTLSCYAQVGANRIEKEVFGTAQSFDNPALSKYDCLKSATTNGIKVFAKMFGIGADLADRENKAYSELRTKVNFNNWTEADLEVEEDDGEDIKKEDFNAVKPDTPKEQTTVDEAVEDAEVKKEEKPKPEKKPKSEKKVEKEKEAPKTDEKPPLKDLFKPKNKQEMEKEEAEGAELLKIEGVLEKIDGADEQQLEKYRVNLEARKDSFTEFQQETLNEAISKRQVEITPEEDEEEEAAPEEEPEKEADLDLEDDEAVEPEVVEDDKDRLGLAVKAIETELATADEDLVNSIEQDLEKDKSTTPAEKESIKKAIEARRLVLELS